MPACESLIRMEAVGKVFYTEEVETRALHNIYLDISQNEYVSIAGPSGCGKSTLLALIGLLDAPSRRETSIPDVAAAIMDMLRQIHQRGTTICVVTHDPRYTRDAERTVQLFDGQIVEGKGSCCLSRLRKDGGGADSLASFALSNKEAA